MLRSCAWRVGLAVILVIGMLGPTPDAFAEADEDDGSQSGGGVQSDGSGGGQVVAFSFEVTTTSASGGVDGGTTTTSSSSGGAYVRPACWYEPRGTGVELATQMRKDHRKSRSERPPADWKGGVWVTTRMDYAAHADDGNGMWYQAKCDTSTKEGQNQLTELSLAERIWVWEPDGQRAAPEPVVDPVTLARAAVEAAAIPAPSVETNPRITTDDGVEGAAVVGVDTWVWAASGTPSHVEVRATAGSTSVTVAADAGGLSLSAPRARTRCTGWGEPWREGTSREGDSDCVVVFTRSAARVPLTVSATYDITWTSTNGQSGTLDALTTTTTIDLPVAEIQTINRPTPTH